MGRRVQFGHPSRVRGPRLVQVRGRVNGVPSPQVLWRVVADPSQVSCRVSPIDRGRPEWLDVRHSIQYP